MNAVSHVRRESSVRHLQQLYTIVAGLALSDAIATMVRETDVGWRDPVALSLLVGFVVTLVPFFHGALRHFDDTYLLSNGVGSPTRASLAVDFAFLFCESGLLFGLAHQVTHVKAFAMLLGILLIVDIVWVVAISGAAARGRSFWQEVIIIGTSFRQSVVAQQHWAKNNLRHVVLIALFLIVAQLGWLNETAGGVLILLIALSRTALDYLGAWDFYFPD